MSSEHRLFKRTAYLPQTAAERIIREYGRMPSLYVVITPTGQICEGDRVLGRFFGNTMATNAVNRKVSITFGGYAFKYVEVR